MKAVIATCFESNEERVSFVYDSLKKKEFDVKVVTSDFSHIKKEKRNNIPNGYSFISTQPYSRNLSWERIRSHQKFAKDLFKLMEKEKPDLIWLMAPANSLIKEANTYKKTHDVKLIIDIIDMWPESLPIGLNKHVFPLNIWRNVRKKNINCADILATECDLYKDILSKEYRKQIKTIYWARNKADFDKKTDLPEDKLSLVYIGSINNIIDIDRICRLVKSCDEEVVFHLIGEGEKTDEMIRKLKEVCEVIYHGAIRDENSKQEIFSKCHAGINIYKQGLYIGLTVKCIDYLEHGLPLINNIKGDTWNFVISENVGINVNEETILKAQDLIDLRQHNQHIFDFYDRNFTKEVFEDKCKNIIDEVMK